VKLYSTPPPPPNPRRVRIFLAEKGVTIPIVNLEPVRGETKTPEFLARNSLGQLPVLELDDGTCISESLAICRYLERIYPDPPLFGSGPIEEAWVDMWTRRLEFQLWVHVGSYWRHLHPFGVREGVPRHADLGEMALRDYDKALEWLDGELAGRDYLAIDSFSVADICLLTTLDFADWAGLKVPERLINLSRWHERVSVRPSATA
jgi:glutathione S-transferase